MTSVLIRRGEDRETQSRRRPCEDGDRDCSDAGEGQAKDGQEPSEAGRGKEAFFPAACRESTALLTP